MEEVRNYGSIVLENANMPSDQLLEMEGGLAKALAFVRQTINIRRAIGNAIPPEVLAIIFKYAVQWRDSGLQCRSFEPPNHLSCMLDRLRLGAVCSRWRMVALSMAEFWTTIDESHQALQDEFLRRSQDTAPLTVLLPDIRQNGSLLAAHAHRIRDLFMKLGSDRQPQLAFSLPTLECLTMTGKDRFPTHRIAADSQDYISIFPSDPPRLRVLVMREALWFPAIAYGALTHVHIDNSRLRSLTSLLNILAVCAPALQYLTLVNISISDGGALVPPSLVELSRLQRLVLGQAVEGPHFHFGLVPLLRYLTLPPSAVIHITGGSSMLTALESVSKLSASPALAGIAECTALTLETCAQQPPAMQAGECASCAGPAREFVRTTAVLSGAAADPRARLSLRLWGGVREPLVRAALAALVPWATLTSVTYRCTSNDTLLLDLVRQMEADRVRALRVVQGSDMMPLIVDLFAVEVGKLVGGNGRPGWAGMELDELEVWAEDASFLGRMGLAARSAKGVERIVFHWPAWQEGPEERVVKKLPQLELCSFEGTTAESAAPMEELDSVEEGFFWR
ncbi:uncharacterized protein BXZ73DRAFT_83198 [Epithele typhae]|uniref:uncharacterized protein n=1 Tax=Epithele typhae TaxID=378194 RepID=UPI00200846F5|nr:uncharacterized protein BXZ73DRAFT_83198 [Epithele typhae]KAH9910782.1 hypothetical protein BXZ73DRAFT_83198 [Epithele typhae]